MNIKNNLEHSFYPKNVKTIRKLNKLKDLYQNTTTSFNKMITSHD